MPIFCGMISVEEANNCLKNQIPVWRWCNRPRKALITGIFEDDYDSKLTTLFFRWFVRGYKVIDDNDFIGNFYETKEECKKAQFKKHETSKNV